MFTLGFNALVCTLVLSSYLSASCKPCMCVPNWCAAVLAGVVGGVPSPSENYTDGVSLALLEYDVLFPPEDTEPQLVGSLSASDPLLL